MSLLEAIIIGIVQGLTEFLPVGSSGHIEIAKAIGNVHLSENLFFTVLLHLATALSTIVIFRNELVQLFYGLFKKGINDDKKYFYYIVLSMIPAALVGVFFEDQIETLFEGNLLLVGFMLLVTAAILYASDIRNKDHFKSLNAPVAIVMGIVQAIAILPGISRSGSTIGTGLIMGMERSTAARFSFIMVLPLILGAAAKKFLEYESAAVTPARDLSVTIMAGGFIAAFLSGLLALRWMIRLVENSKLKWFALYCSIAGIISILYSFS